MTEFFQFICEQLGVRIRSTGYRGQFNSANCVGIVFPQEDVGMDDLNDFVAALLSSHLDPNDEDDRKILNQAAKAFKDMRSDSMGLGMVYYFPYEKWKQEYSQWMEDENPEY